MASRVGPTGPGWFGVEEFASRYGLTVGKARVIVEGLHRDGKLDFWSGVTGTPARKRNLYRYKKAVDSTEPMAIVSGLCTLGQYSDGCWWA